MQVTQAQIDDFKRRSPEHARALYEEGAALERDRWRGIEAVAKDLGPWCAPLVKAMKADGRCTGGDLAVAAMAMTRSDDYNANVSMDRVAIQRDANKDWNDNEPLRHAFNKDQRMYTEYRVALAKAAAAKAA